MRLPFLCLVQLALQAHDLNSYRTTLAPGRRPIKYPRVRANNLANTGLDPVALLPIANASGAPFARDAAARTILRLPSVHLRSVGEQATPRSHRPTRPPDSAGSAWVPEVSCASPEPRGETPRGTRPMPTFLRLMPPDRKSLAPWKTPDFELVLRDGLSGGPSLLRRRAYQTRPAAAMPAPSPAAA